MFSLEDITFEKVIKAVGVGAGACTIAVIAPLGVTAVVAITAVAAATSWAVDSVGDEIKKGSEDKNKSN
jgi:hypothetical protein